MLSSACGQQPLALQFGLECHQRLRGSTKKQRAARRRWELKWFVGWCSGDPGKSRLGEIAGKIVSTYPLSFTQCCWRTGCGSWLWHSYKNPLRSRADNLMREKISPYNPPPQIESRHPLLVRQKTNVSGGWDWTRVKKNWQTKRLSQRKAADTNVPGEGEKNEGTS